MAANGHCAGMRVILGVTLFAALALVAGCDGDDANPVAGPSSRDQVATAPRGDLDVAEFNLATGVTTLIVRSADLDDQLYRLTTPAGAGIAPRAVVTSGRVTAQTVSSGHDGPSVLDVTLNSAVAWTIHLDGGATEATVDFRPGGLASIDFAAGVTRIDLSVPNRTAAIRMSGGASVFTVHAPPGLVTRVALNGGGSTATIDGTTHTGIAGGTTYEPPDWPTASPRLDITNAAGVSTFTLDRY